MRAPHISLLRFVAVTLALGCNKADDEPEKPSIEDASACGAEVTGVGMTFIGLTGNASRQPLDGVAIRLEDRWVRPPSVLGTTVSTAGGNFSLDAEDISYLDDCWGSTDFVLVGEKEGMMGEIAVSREMHGAILDKSYLVDLGRQGLLLDTPVD